MSRIFDPDVYDTRLDSFRSDDRCRGQSYHEAEFIARHDNDFGRQREERYGFDNDRYETLA
jgi:hypothetical protein